MMIENSQDTPISIQEKNYYFFFLNLDLCSIVGHLTLAWLVVENESWLDPLDA